VFVELLTALATPEPMVAPRGALRTLTDRHRAAGRPRIPFNPLRARNRACQIYRMVKL
jgi:hypothetical protein